MSSRVHQTEEGLNLRFGRETLISHVDTMDRELKSVRTQQKDLSVRVDRDLKTLSHRHLDISNTPVTKEGMFSVRDGVLYMSQKP